jgi:hypothetical protein
MFDLLPIVHCNLREKAGKKSGWGRQIFGKVFYFLGGEEAVLRIVIFSCCDNMGIAIVGKIEAWMEPLRTAGAKPWIGNCF